MNRMGEKYLCSCFKGVAWLLLFLLLVRVILFLDSEGSAFPHWDEWRFQNDASFSQTIFALNNENFQVFTNALYWLAPRVGFPFWGLRYVSLLLLLAAMLVLYQVLQKNVADNRRWLLILAFCPCFSAYMCGNLLWSGLSQAWLYFLFIFGAVKLGFSGTNTPMRQAEVFVLIGAAFLAMNISLPLLFALLYGARACYLKEKLPQEIFYGDILVVGATLAAVVWLYWVVRSHDDTEFSFMTLLTADYWLWLSYALVGVWSGFWISPQETWFYYLGGGVMILGLGLLFCRQVRCLNTHCTWAVALILLGGIAMITLYRGEAMLAVGGHAVRHIVYGVFLIPIIYTLGANDKNRYIRLLADGWLVFVLICQLPSLVRLQMSDGIPFTQFGDACFMHYLNLEKTYAPFTCGRYQQDVREPYRYFVTTDAAFRQAYQKGKVQSYLIPYHFEGTVFYKIPGKKLLSFR